MPPTAAAGREPTLAWDISAEGLGVGLLRPVTAMSVTATAMATRTPTAIASLREGLRLATRGRLDDQRETIAHANSALAAIFGAAYAVQPAYGVGFSKEVYLWIPVVGNIIAVVIIPYVGALSDKIGRRPPMIVGSLSAALLSFLYLYAISIHDVWMAIVVSLLMWGVLYQGYNAVFPAFYPELFRTRYRVSAMAIGQNIGTAISAFLPALFAEVAPPGSTNIPLRIGLITFGIAVVACVAAYSARETYRLRLDDLGNPNATPVPKEEFEKIKAQSEIETTGGGATGLASG